MDNDHEIMSSVEKREIYPSFIEQESEADSSGVDMGVQESSADAQSQLINVFLSNFHNSTLLTPSLKDLEDDRSLIYVASPNITDSKGRVLVSCSSLGCTETVDLLEDVKAGIKRQGIFLLKHTLTYECPEHRRPFPTFCVCDNTDDLNMIQCHNCSGWYHYACMGIEENLLPADYEYECVECKSNPIERRIKLYEENTQNEELFYAYRNAEDVILFFAKVLKGTTVRYAQQFFDAVATASFENGSVSFSLSEMKQYIRSLNVILSDLAELQSGNDGNDNDEELMRSIEGADNFNVLDGVKDRILMWKKEAEARIESYKSDESTLLANIAVIVAEAKESARPQQFLINRTLNIISLHDEMYDSLKKLKSTLSPPRDIKDELDTFLVALGWIKSLFQILGTSRSEDLLSEVNALLQSGRKLLEALLSRRRRANFASSHLKLGVNTCCGFFYPIFEKYYLRTENAHNELLKYLEEAKELLMNAGQITDGESDKLTRKKFGRDKISDLIRKIKDTLPLNNPLPELSGLGDLLSRSERLSKAISNLSNLNSSNLPAMRGLLEVVNRLPVTVSETNLLENLICFLDTFDEEKRVSLRNCNSVGFSFTPLVGTLNTADVKTHSLAESHLEGELAQSLIKTDELMKNDDIVLQIKNFLTLCDPTTNSLRSDERDSFDTSSTYAPVETDSESAVVEVDFHKAKILLQCLSKSKIIYPEEDALKFLVKIPSYITSATFAASQNSPPELSMEEAKDRITWIKNNFVRCEPYLCGFPVVVHVLDHFVKPYIAVLKGWVESMERNWATVRLLLIYCERGNAVVLDDDDYDIENQDAMNNNTEAESCTLEQLRSEVAKAINSCRAFGNTVSDENGWSLLSSFVSTCLSDGGNTKGLCISYCQDYVEIEENKVPHLIQSLSNDCLLLDSIILHCGNVDANGNIADSLQKLELLYERWGREGHFQYVPLKELMQQQIHRRYKMVQVLLSAIRLIPVNLNGILSDCNSAYGKAYLPAVLDTLQRNSKTLQQLYTQGTTCLQNEHDNNSNSPKDKCELGQYYFPGEVIDAAKRYFSYMQYNIWCLDAWHTIWSGSPLSDGERLLDHLEGQRELWQQFLFVGDSRAVTKLEKCLELTKYKQSSVEKIRIDYSEKEKELNVSYEKEVMTQRHTESLSLLRVLMTHFEHYSSLVQSTAVELSKISLADHGLRFVHSAKDLFNILKEDEFTELELPDAKSFTNELNKISSMIQNSSTVCHFLKSAVQVNGELLTAFGQAQSRSNISIKNEPGIYKKSDFQELTKYFSQWNAKESSLQSYISQPIMRDIALNLSALHSKAQQWATKVKEMLPPNFTLTSLLASETRQRRQRLKQDVKRSHSVEEFSNMLEDPIVKAVTFPYVEDIRKLTGKAEVCTPTIHKLFFNESSISSREEGDALVTSYTFPPNSDHLPLSEYIEASLARVQEVMSDLKNFPMTFPSMEALLWFQEVLLWLQDLPPRLLDVYKVVSNTRQHRVNVNDGNQARSVQSNSVEYVSAGHTCSLTGTDERSCVTARDNTNSHESVSSSLEAQSSTAPSCDTKPHVQTDVENFGTENVDIVGDTVKFISIEHSFKSRSELRNVLSCDESVEIMDEGERLLLDRFAVPDKLHPPEYVTSIVTAENRLVLELLLKLHIVDVDSRPECEDMFTFPLPWTILRRKGLPGKAFYCHPLLVTASEILWFMRHEYQRVVIWSAKTKHKIDEFDQTIVNLEKYVQNEVETVDFEGITARIREDVKALQKSSRNDFLVCGQREICDRLEYLLAKLRKLKDMLREESLSKKRKTREDESLAQELEEHQDKRPKALKRGHSKNDIPSDFDPEGPPWVAKCSGCGTWGEYSLGSGYTTSGVKSYKRHKNDGKYCGMFKNSPRLAIGTEISQHKSGLKASRGSARGNKSDSLAKVSAPSKVKIDDIGATHKRMTQCYKCSKAMKYSEESCYCSGECAVQNVTQYVADLLQYRKHLCAGVIPSKNDSDSGADRNESAEQSRSGGFTVSKLDTKAFKTAFVFPKSEQFLAFEKLMGGKADSSNFMNSNVDLSLPPLCYKPGLMYIPLSNNASTSDIPVSPRSIKENTDDIRQNRRDRLYEAFFQSLERILELQTPFSSLNGLSRLSCPRAAALTLCREVEKNIFENYPFDTQQDSQANKINQKEYSKKVLKFYRLFRSPGADTKMIEVLDRRMSIPDLLNANMESLRDESVKKRFAKELSEKNLGLEERSTHVLEIFEKRRREVDVGLPAWRDGSSSSAGIEVNEFASSSTIPSAELPILPSNGENNDAPILLDGPPSQKGSSIVSKQASQVKSAVNGSDKLRSVSDASKKSFSDSIETTDDIGKIEKSRDPSPRTLDITSILQNSSSKHNKMRKDKGAPSDSARSLLSVPSRGRISSVSSSSASSQHRDESFSFGKPFLRADGKTVFNMIFDTEGKLYNVLCIAGITDLATVDDVGFLPSDIHFRRLSVPDVHSLKGSDKFVSSRKRVFNICILITDEQGEESGYLKLLAQLNNPDKERVLHFCEKRRNKFEIFAYTPEQAKLIPVLKEIKFKCFEHYRKCKWLFAEVFCSEDMEISRSTHLAGYSTNAKCFPPDLPEIYPQIQHVENDLKRAAKKGHHGVDPILQSQELYVKDEFNPFPSTTGSNSDVENSLKHSLNRMAEITETYEDYHDAVVTLRKMITETTEHSDFRPYLDPTYSPYDESNEEGDNTSKYQWCLDVMRTSIMHVIEKDPLKADWLSKFDNDSKHSFESSMNFDLNEGNEKRDLSDKATKSLGKRSREEGEVDEVEVQSVIDSGRDDKTTTKGSERPKSIKMRSGIIWKSKK